MQPLNMSAVDEARFGVRTAKAHSDDPEELEPMLVACCAQGVELLILRVPVSAQATVHAAERLGFLLMDVLCHYERLVPKRPIEADVRSPTASYRLATPADANLVEGLARDAFQNYPSHYFNDPNLSALDVAEVYPSWTRSCCERATEQEPLILANEGAHLIGFAALRQSAPEELDVALLAIAPAARGRGHATALLRHVSCVASHLGVQRLTYSTQITNLSMQRTLAREGFLPTHSIYTFHVWTGPRCA